MSVREEQDQLAKEKAAAYRLMMDMWAFKDHLSFIKSIKENAVKSLYTTVDDKATEAQFGRIRGILETVDKIERELEFILNFKEGI